MSDFQHRIFEEFYSLFDKQSDPNKDANGKGTQQRFTEVWGKVVDGTHGYIDDLVPNNIDPIRKYPAFVPYAEEALGYESSWIWFIGSSINFRRHLAVIERRLAKIRGTIPCYRVMFKWLGISMTITEDLDYLGGFDSPLVTFDSPLRKFDSYSRNDINYSLALTGPGAPTPSTGFPIVLPYTFSSFSFVPIPPSYDPNAAAPVLELMRAIYTILLYNQAVNIKLEAITYNGIDIIDYLKAITPNYLNFA